MLETFFNLILPNLCLLCNQIMGTEGLCASCWDKLTFLHKNACLRCQAQFTIRHIGLCSNCNNKQYYLDSIRSPLQYNSRSKSLILSAKNKNNILAIKLLVKFMLTALTEYQYDYIVAVPLHWTRLIWRGYNQAEILAKYISSDTKIKCLPNCLIRTKATKSQGHFLRAARIENVRNAFELNWGAEQITDSTILLIDDVCTTSSTLEECAKALKQAGAKAVHGLTAAKT